MKKNEDDQGKFPDLSGDGDVTMKDILIGRGVIKKAEGGSMSDSRKDVLLDEIKSLKDKGEDFINSPAAAELMQVYDINVKEIPLMGGGSINEKMKYGGGGDIMIKTVEVSMKVPERQKRGTGAAMTGTKFSGTY